MDIEAYSSANYAWIGELSHLYNHGEEIAPRGIKTKEILNNCFSFPMQSPVTYHQNRKLSYKFMAGEALWIISGDNSTKGIVPYNKHIAQFSDNGQIFNGAYGPPFQEQVPYITRSLKNDMFTRQAVMTIWNRRPEQSKDIPCTVALSWNIRPNSNGDPQLNCHVFMRSSDIWLGLPYDMFNFTMMSYYIGFQIGRADLKPGLVYMNLVSSHLYDNNYAAASKILITKPDKDTFLLPTNFTMWPSLQRSLIMCRDMTYIDKDPTIWRIRP